MDPAAWMNQAAVTSVCRTRCFVVGAASARSACMRRAMTNEMAPPPIALAKIGVRAVRLSVWEWRRGAIALYERLGFTVTESWDERDRLVCMEYDV